MLSKAIILLHFMEKLMKNDRCFLKISFHHKVSLTQSSSSFDQGWKQVLNNAIGTFTTTHSIIQLESSLTDKEASVKRRR